MISTGKILYCEPCKPNEFLEQHGALELEHMQAPIISKKTEVFGEREVLLMREITLTGALSTAATVVQN